MRKRNHQIKVWMNDHELKKLDEKCKLSGQTRQSYILNAVDGAVIATSEQVNAFMEISLQLADFMKQLRGLATNINQQARHANEKGQVASEEELEKQTDEIFKMRKEGEEIWRSLRRLISRQNHMER